MLSLTEEMAQAIVDKMMEVIPYNVNIMDSKGIIIGSGDKGRLGKQHKGAVEALNNRILIEVYEEQESVKPGVNMPIYFNDEIMGVIGISGAPDEVKPLASLVTVTAELLIKQESVFIERRKREKKKEEVLYQWAFSVDEYSQEFIKAAINLGIDLKLPRIAVAVSRRTGTVLPKSKLEAFLMAQEYIITMDTNTSILLLKKDIRLEKRLRIMKEELSDKGNYIVTMGNAEDYIGKSVKEALWTGNLIKRLELKKYSSTYEEMDMIEALSSIKNKEKYIGIMKSLEEEGKEVELIKTFACYFYNNGELNKTAQEMHLHRNSLNYRLQRINEITGLNPKSYGDLLRLFTAYIIYKLYK
ncbi:CdaR family transcriptional regulator [Alloiococcus sp. CFN-8]|uniref:CdaR family transcriptional regulator n=1 Tax=Alloiococcus sp. CFN-8 TaxID=3416081 RepID=UPI003CFA0593